MGGYNQNIEESMEHLNIDIRDSQSADLDALQKLVNSLYLEDSRPGMVHIPEIQATFRELQRHPEKGRLISFVRAGKVVGYCILINFWSNEYSGDIIEVDEIFVDKSNRGCGIGSQLFDWLEKESGSNAVGFSLQVTPSNARARSLYEKLGFSLSPNNHFIKLLK